MGWDASVYLAKKRIASSSIRETYSVMQKRFGAPIEVEDDPEAFAFARFRLWLKRDATAGMYLFVSHEDVGDEDVDDADLCMHEWATLLGGEISEEEWNERAAGARKKKLEDLKLPKYGPADTYGYFAFDGEGKEQGRKSIAIELARAVKPKILEPAWLREHHVARVERLTFDGEGVTRDHVSYEVDEDGTLRDNY